MPVVRPSSPLLYCCSKMFSTWCWGLFEDFHSQAKLSFTDASIRPIRSKMFGTRRTTIYSVPFTHESLRTLTQINSARSIIRVELFFTSNWLSRVTHGLTFELQARTELFPVFGKRARYFVVYLFLTKNNNYRAIINEYRYAIYRM